jgi:hypothetical protein
VLAERFGGCASIAVRRFGKNVVYYKTHQTPATEVDFFVELSRNQLHATDPGTFTYDARINHTPINARPGVVLAGRHAGPLPAVARSVRNRKGSGIAIDTLVTGNERNLRRALELRRTIEAFRG